MELMELVENEPTARPFQCNWQACNKSFNRKSDLQRHYRIHTNERPYQCTTMGCGKSFIQRSALTVHIRTHTGEKPHQCKHINCGKRFSDSSSLARHRRIHTGKRPYKCGHDGCLKSFCRKTTMVKHQRRSHQRGVHSSELDDYTSESGSDESPTTPKSGSVPWAPPAMSLMGHGGDVLQRAASYADFGHHLGTYGIQPHHPYDQRHDVSSGGAHDCHGMPHHHHQDQLQHHPPPPTLHSQNHGHMLQRAPSVPQQHPYYVTEQSNPSVATMNTHPLPPHATATSMPAQYHQMQPHDDAERLSLEIPYASAPGLGTNIQNSPSSFSVDSTRSPNAQNGFYTHAPAAQTATYALHTDSPIEPQQHRHHHQQQHIQHALQPQHHAQPPPPPPPPPPPSQQPPQLIAYPGQMPPQPHVMNQPSQIAQPPPPPPPPSQHSSQQQQQHQRQQQPQRQRQEQVLKSHRQPQQHQLHPAEQYHPPQAQPVVEEPGWYAAYQPPMEVTTIHQIPTYGSTLYDPWGLKSEYDDPSIQMPSARIESL